MATKTAAVTEFLTSANLVTERVTIQFDHGTWMVLHGNGDIEVFKTAAKALIAVQRRAKSAIEVTRSSAGVITTIQWLDAPEGFVPPKGLA